MLHTFGMGSIFRVHSFNYVLRLKIIIWLKSSVHTPCHLSEDPVLIALLIICIIFLSSISNKFYFHFNTCTVHVHVHVHVHYCNTVQQ